MPSVSPTQCVCPTPQPTPAPTDICLNCEQSCHAAISATIGDNTYTFINGETTKNGELKFGATSQSVGATKTKIVETAAGSDNSFTYTGTGSMMNSTYTGSKYTYSAHSDMTYPSTGTVCYGTDGITLDTDGDLGVDCTGGTQVSKIMYTYWVQSYTVTVATVGSDDYTYTQPAFSTDVTYFLVRTPDGVVFRVRGAASDGQLTAGNYLTGLKILDNNATTASPEGLCQSDTSLAGDTAASFTGNNFVNTAWQYDTPTAANTYQGVLTANGWTSNGDAIQSAAAECFNDGTPRSTSTDVVVCDNNNVQLVEAQAACVGAMLGGGADEMLQSCIHDYCAFGGQGKIAESYIIEMKIAADVDVNYLVSTYTVPVTVVEKYTTTVVVNLANITSAEEIMGDTPAAKVNKNTLELIWGFMLEIAELKRICALDARFGDLCSMMESFYIYLDGCNVRVTASAAGRRSEISLTYEATTPTTQVVDTSLATTAGFVTAAAAVQETTNSEALATAITASDVASISETTVQTVSTGGGTVAPTSAGSSDDSQLELILIIVGVLLGVCILVVIVVVVVKVQLSKDDKSDSADAPAETSESFASVGLKQIPAPSTDATTEPVMKEPEESQH